MNANIRDITERFAKQGYVAVAPELFHRTAPGFEEAYTNLPLCMPHAQALTPDGMIADARAAFDWLQNNPRVQAERDCQPRLLHGRTRLVCGKFRDSPEGGGFVLRWRDRSGLLPRAAQQHAPVLFFWGGLDPLIPQDQARAVLDAMKAAKKPFMSVEFSDADHGFFCDARASYKESAAKQAWEIALRFLATNVKS